MFLTNNLLASHIDSILTYWEKAVDKNGGGMFFWVDEAGPETATLDMGRKCLLMHARQLYNYSVGCERNHPAAPAIAQHLYNTLDTIFPQIQGLHPSLFPPGFMRNRNPNDPPVIKAYDQLYLVIGLSRYARACGDKAVFDKADHFFEHTLNTFCPNGYSGNGCSSRIDCASGEVSGVDGNTNLHHVEALVNMGVAASKLLSGDQRTNYLARNKSRILEALAFFESRLFDSEQLCTPEQLTKSQEPMFRHRELYVTMAHPLEWIGFWFEAAQLHSLEIPFLGDPARKLTDSIIERALAPNGLFRNNYYLIEKRCDTVSEFWGQTEAILGLLVAARLFGSPHYAAAADQVGRFYFDHFIDKIYGGVYSELSEAGIVLDRVKGNAFKCDHHSLRICEKVLQWQLLNS